MAATTASKKLRTRTLRAATLSASLLGFLGAYAAVDAATPAPAPAPTPQLAVAPPARTTSRSLPPTTVTGRRTGQPLPQQPGVTTTTPPQQPQPARTHTRTRAS